MTSEREAAVKTNLAESRAYILRVAESMAPADWDLFAYAEDTQWRMLDILRHVADSERGMTALILQIQAGGEGVPADFDLNRWNQRAVLKLQEKTADELLADMVVSREKLLAVIDTLNDDDWDKQGRHASLQIMTIEEVCNLIANHERSHAESIELALAG